MKDGQYALHNYSSKLNDDPDFENRNKMRVREQNKIKHQNN